MTIQPAPNLSASIPNFDEKEGLGERHAHRAAFSKRLEEPFRLRVVGGGKREREALEARIALREAGKRKKR
jgi:hypothetical protein